MQYNLHVREFLMPGFLKDGFAVLDLTIPRYITGFQGHQTLMFVVFLAFLLKDTVYIPPLPITLVELKNRIRAFIESNIQNTLAKVWYEFMSIALSLLI